MHDRLKLKNTFTNSYKMLEQLRNKIPLDNDKWNRHTSCFRQMQVPAKTVLLKEGEISKKLFLIEKGCIRVWFNNNGKDITYGNYSRNVSIGCR